MVDSALPIYGIFSASTTRTGALNVSSVSASYCIPQCVRLIAGVCTHYVVYNISKKKLWRKEECVN